jgi:hypothetical protein
MQAYDKGLLLMARQHGFRYVQGAAGGCPLGHRLVATGVNGQRFKTRNHVCFSEMPAMYRDLVESRHTRVFLATSSNERSPAVDARGHLLTPGSPAHLAAAEKALDESVSYLTSRGAWVVLIHILPRGPGVTCLDNGPLSGPRCNIAVASDTLTPAYNKVLDRVAARHRDRVRVVDLSDIVCPGGVCALVEHGLVMRYDGGHFTRRASEYVVPFLYSRARAAGVPLP